MMRPVELTGNVEKYDIADKVIGQGLVWRLIGSPVTCKIHSSRQARVQARARANVLGLIVGQRVGTLAPTEARAP